MASSFPTTLDALVTTRQDDTDMKTGSDLGVSTTTGAHAQDHNDVADAVNKIEAELGTLPKGPYAANVRERFEISSYKNQSCRIATTAVLPTVTYANGTAGVGAALTASANGVMAAVDGVTPVVADRLLVKNQASSLQNGIYTVTSIGAAGAPFVLTRAVDADTSAKIADCKVMIDVGTLQGDTEWLQSSTAPTMGTTALYFRRTSPPHGHGNHRNLWTPGHVVNSAAIIGESVPWSLINTAFTLVTATQMLIGGIVAPAGRTVSNVNVIYTTTSATVTVRWFSLIRVSDRLTMAHTANNTANPTISIPTVYALATPWTPTEDTPIWVVWSTAATTPGAVAAGPTGTAVINLINPAKSATNGVSPTTTVPTDGSTVATAATAGVTNTPYVWLT